MKDIDIRSVRTGIVGKTILGYHRSGDGDPVRASGAKISEKPPPGPPTATPAGAA